jgi:hypothetical protein
MIRSLLLPAALGTVMCGVFFLPKSGDPAESAISMTLPDTLGHWRLKKAPASEAEVRILAKDTDFSKAVCLAPIPGQYADDGRQMAQRLDVSIVLSGIDINNSIHRPERCMPAQGHQIYDDLSSTVTMKDGRTFPARRLTSVQTLTMADEKELKLHCLTYYFFVGQHVITDDHLKRTLVDMEDRIVRGQDQRWAYVSASMWFSEKGELGLQPIETVDKEIRQFLGNLAESNIDWEKIATR